VDGTAPRGCVWDGPPRPTDDQTPWVGGPLGLTWGLVSHAATVTRPLLTSGQVWLMDVIYDSLSLFCGWYLVLPDIFRRFMAIFKMEFREKTY
jgi:hypothetical protein